MRRFLVLALLPVFLSGCGETVAVAPAPEKAPEVIVTEKPVPAPAPVRTEAPAPRRVAETRVGNDGMLIIPTMPLPKGWTYMGEADLRKG